jgi:hypothetical protein
MWGGLRESWGTPPHIPDSPSISSSWRLRVHMAEGACIALFFAVPVPSVDPVRLVAPPSLHLWRQGPLSPSPSSFLQLHLPQSDYVRELLHLLLRLDGYLDAYSSPPRRKMFKPFLPTHISLI